jgi:hypothetical protein
MLTAERCRVRAAECQRMAEQAPNARVRDILIDMARTWMRLALEAEQWTQMNRPTVRLTKIATLRQRRNEARAFLFAFDLLELDGLDMRREPIETRKATLASILRKSLPGVRLNEHMAHPKGALVFQHREVNTRRELCHKPPFGRTKQTISRSYGSPRGPYIVSMKR